MMKIVKRDGTIVDFDPEKIRIAIGKANNEVRGREKISKEKIEEIIDYIKDLNKNRFLVEDIQDIIEEQLMEFDKYQLAKKYITYTYTPKTRKAIRRYCASRTIRPSLPPCWMPTLPASRARTIWRRWQRLAKRYFPKSLPAFRSSAMRKHSAGVTLSLMCFSMKRNSIS